MTEQQRQAFLEYCNEPGRLNYGIPDMTYYSSLALCLFDAIYSIRVGYNVVIQKVNGLANLLHIERDANPNNIIPGIQDQTSISSVLESLNGYTANSLANELNARHRTAGRRSILKTDAFLQGMNILHRFNVDTYQDLDRCLLERPEIETNLKSIMGQKVSIDYFLMLAGDSNRVKVDTHLRNFVCNAIGVNVIDNEDVIDLVTLAAAQHGITPRHMDHIIWSFQRNQN